MLCLSNFSCSFTFAYYATPLIGGGIKRCFYLTSVAYIGPKSRTERHRKTKIGTEVAHVTRDSDTTSRSKGQRSTLPGRFAHRRVGASGGCSGGRGKLLLRCRLLGGGRWFGANGGGRWAGAYRDGRPPTACFICF